jgi:hypothetical protein
MAVTTFHDFPLASRDREWDGAAAEKRVRAWADAEDKPNPRYRDAHLWYDASSKQNFTAHKLLFTDIVNGRHVAMPRAIMATFLLTALHWDQAKALAGQDRQPPRFRPRLKRRDPLSATARVTLLVAVTAFGILPYAEELLRCWRASPGLSPLPQSAEPATDTLRAPGQVSDLRQSRPSEAPASGN